MKVWVHRSAGIGVNRQVYQCPITVGIVGNAVNDAHHVSDEIARPAVTSICPIKAEGRGCPLRLESISAPYLQVSYDCFSIREMPDTLLIATDGSGWATHLKPPNEVGSFMAQFAMGSIATIG